MTITFRSSGQQTAIASYKFLFPNLNYTLITNGSSTAGWTSYTGTLTSDSGFGNPAPSFNGSTNSVAYVNIASIIPGFTTFWGRTIKFDAWAPTNGLVDVFIGTNSTGGGGSVFRVDGRSGYYSGMNTTTATTSPWSFTATNWSSSTGPQLTGGTWYTIIITIAANGTATWTYNGTAWHGTSYTINNGGTYFVFEPEVAVGYIDNIYIA